MYQETTPMVGIPVPLLPALACGKTGKETSWFVQTVAEELLRPVLINPFAQEQRIGMPMEDDDDEDFAVGLTADDVIALVSLVSAKTDARIIDIISEGEGATITTGAVFAANAGSGQSFKCERTPTGWRIEDAGDWIC